MTRAGGLPGSLFSEVKNVHSGRVYFVLTGPEIGQDYWTTNIFPAVEKKHAFGLVVKLEPDLHHSAGGFIRNSMQKAHEIHGQIHVLVTMTAEDNWMDAFPSPSPPDGYSEGARKKLKEALGYDPISDHSTD